MNNLIPRGLYLSDQIKTKIGISIFLKKYYLTNFIQRKLRLFQRNVSEEKALLPHEARTCP